MNKKVLLMILDGWGVGDRNVSAIDHAHTPYIDSLYQTYPHSLLEASGLAVGLPMGQAGNSEVGHMNIGAGRIVHQDIMRIDHAIKSDDLQKNNVLMRALEYSKEKKKNLHLMGLLSDGGVHAHINHLKALISIAHQKNIRHLFVHAFTDGRDTDPKSGVLFLKELHQHMSETTGQLATIVGRYFAMDRNKQWDRIKVAYDALLKGDGVHSSDWYETMLQSYKTGVTDEFIRPIVLTHKEGAPTPRIEEGDVVLCFNFRTDRTRQLTDALTQNHFPKWNMKPLDLHYVTFTRYDETFNHVHAILESENLTNTLGEVIASAGKPQLRIAETEKYPHVTFFFSGGRELPFTGEKRILCPSPRVSTYDLAPEMSAHDLRHSVNLEMQKQWADFICLNFANPDMVGHTGVWDACVKACETVDVCSQSVIEEALRNNYTVVLIADHGNADKMINEDGSPNTAHTVNPVPCILIDHEFVGSINNGKLSDLAPTILTLMGLTIPKEMTGEILIQ